MESFPLLSNVAVAGFLGFTAAAAVSDVRRMKIPNVLCIGIVLLYPLFVVASAEPVDWVSGLLVAGAVLVAGFALFTTGRVGGGDAKLMAAVSLWAGSHLVLELMLLTALVGGVLAVILWLHHRWSRAPSLAAVAATQAAPDFAQQPMPYGVAIFAGAVYVAFTLLGIV